MIQVSPEVLPGCRHWAGGTGSLSSLWKQGLAGLGVQAGTFPRGIFCKLHLGLRVPFKLFDLESSVRAALWPRVTFQESSHVKRTASKTRSHGGWEV